MKYLRLAILFSVILLSICTDQGTPYPAVINEPIYLDFFPLGLYTVPQADLGDAKETGFNMVQIYHSTQTLPEAMAYLEAAEVAGLIVNQNMPRNYLSAGDEFWIDWVTRLSYYDSLAWWYLPEEPDVRGVSEDDIASLFEIIHQYDSQQRPAALYLGSTQDINTWCDVADILMIGCYPEYHGEPRSCVRSRIDLARQACPSKPVVGVLPFFDSNDFGVTGGYPTPHEARFDAYTSLIAGAGGLYWFSYQEGAHLEDLWEGIHTIVEELTELKDVILSTKVLSNISVEVVSGPTNIPNAYDSPHESIQILQKEDRSGRYLFSSNLAADTVIAEFSGLPMEVTAVDVLFEGRSIAVIDGSFQDKFSEADVHIYQLVISCTSTHSGYFVQYK